MPTQPFLMMVPLSGQKQLSTGATWQLADTLFPLLSIAVQLVHRKPAIAWSGAINNAALKIMAAKLLSKSVLFFISKPLSAQSPAGCKESAIKVAVQAFRAKNPLWEMQAIVGDDPAS